MDTLSRFAVPLSWPRDKRRFSGLKSRAGRFLSRPYVVKGVQVKCICLNIWEGHKRYYRCIALSWAHLQDSRTRLPSVWPNSATDRVIDNPLLSLSRLERPQKQIPCPVHWVQPVMSCVNSSPAETVLVVLVSFVVKSPQRSVSH